MTSLPYVVLFFFYICTAFLEHKVSRKNQVQLIRALVIVVTLVFLGLRGHILTDFINYYPFFQNLETSHLANDNSLFAPGFIYFGYFVKQIFDNYHFWIFASSLIHVSILGFIFTKYLGNISLGLVFFLAYRGVFVEFNLMQNIMSILLFITSITFLYQRRFLPYLLLNLIGISFHVSSLIYLPLYFIINRNTSMVGGFIIIGVANLFYFVGSDVLIKILFWLVSNSGNSAIESYLYFFIDTSNYQLSFGFLERTLLIVLMTIYCEKIKSEILHGKIFYNLALLYYFSFLLLSPVDVLTDRVPILFLLSYWIVLPGLIILKHRYRTMIACVLISLSFAKLTLSTQDQVSEYDNLLFGIKSYELRRNEVLQFLEQSQ
jgi:hypothetical protein